MQVYKTYKYKLKLTKAQATTIDQWIGTCRFIYNLALETKKAAWEKRINISRYQLQAQLPALKDFEWIQSVPAQSLQAVIERLDISYQKFFKGAGFPKWAKKGEYNSIAFRSFKQTTNGFNIIKLGDVKVFKDRMPCGKLKMAVIKKEGKDYFLSVSFECESENQYPASKNQAVGLDMGLTHFLTDSNGGIVDNPNYTKKYAARLRVKNRAIARKRKGSVAFENTKSEIQKLHRKIVNCRKDFLHKTSLQYIKHNSLVVCENLKIKNLVKNSHLAKSINDASWSSFFYMLDFKCKFYEKTFVKIKPHFTSQTCNSCGHVAKESRVTRSIFKCVQCGHKEDADYNAAKNILGEGIALIRKREGLPCA